MITRWPYPRHGDTPNKINNSCQTRADRLNAKFKGRRSWFLSVFLSITLAGPAPSGSADTSRLCQGCSHPYPAPPGTGCPQLHRPAATGSAAGGLSPPTQTTAPHGAHGSRLRSHHPPGVPGCSRKVLMVWTFGAGERRYRARSIDGVRARRAWLFGPNPTAPQNQRTGADG